MLNHILYVEIKNYNTSSVTASYMRFILLHVQASEAELIFNRYRRDGHQFSVSVYNKLLQCWVKKASKVTVHEYLYVVTHTLH